MLDLIIKVKQLRKEKGISQSVLAQELGVTLRTVQSYETGKSYPKRREIYQKLAEYFSCDQNYLMTEDATFLTDATSQYGTRGANQTKKLLEELSGLFAGGELAEEDKDEMMKAIQDAYWIAKENNRKYVPKKYRDENK